MNRSTLILTGAAIFAVGLIALAVHRFDYTETDTAFSMGPVAVQVDEHKSLDVPTWAGVGLTALGSLLMARRVTAPVQGLVEAARRLGRGDHDTPLPPPPREQIE